MELTSEVNCCGVMLPDRTRRRLAIVLTKRTTVENGNIHRPRRMTIKRSRVRIVSRFSGGRRRPNLRARRAADFNQPMALQLLDQLEQVTLAPVGFDLVLLQECVSDLPQV